MSCHHNYYMPQVQIQQSPYAAALATVKSSTKILYFIKKFVTFD